MSDESSDGAPAKPRKKVRRVMLLSDADDDSDSSGGVVRRRKRLRVVSDADSESSGSDIIVRRRALRQLQESDNDSSGWETDPSPNNTEAGMLKTSGFSSDSSEGNSDKCAICLLRFKQQEVGIPNNCQHYFCIDCITEWSKNVNTCPVDRSIFTSIFVRSSIGGKELRSVPVKVAERRLSEEILVIEDPTYCQICRHCDREEYMLLCDTCDMGYHMDCLSPPLEHIPLEEWHCPECTGAGAGEAETEEEVDFDVPLREAARAHRSIVTRATPRLAHYRRQPTTTGSSQPSTSRSTTSASTSRAATSRPRRRRRTRTVVVEYELADGTKRPVTRTVKVKRRKKKRKARRQPRTVARRKHVRASVQARLRSLRDTITREAVTTSRPVGELALSRHRAGIPSLSLFGDASQLEYFSDDEDVESGSAGGVAVVPRMSTSSILGSLRQSRRKAVVVNSPQHASAAPDILSTILESQALLHSRNSLVAVSVDGTVNIKLHKAESSKNNNNEIETPKAFKQEKVDISKADDTSKKVPSYPGQSRGGNWNGGYRDNYNRNQGNNYNNNNRNNYDYRGGGDFQGRGSFNNTNDWHNNRSQNFESDYRQNRPEFHDSDPYERPLNDNNRFPNNRGRGTGRFNDLRRNSGPWQFGGSHQGPDPPLRHSFGGFDDAIDMRMSQEMHSNNSAVYEDSNTRFRHDISQDNVNMYEDVEGQNNYSQENVNMYDGRREENEENIDLYSDIENNRKAPTPPTFAPLPEPPVFRFPVETEKSEDEKSDSGLVIDTEKYDPNDPTHGDSSGDESKPSSSRTNKHLQYPFQRATEPNTLSITSTVLDKAVELVLQEHRNLIANKSRQDSDESDGDCPNFSIYSATSVNIANNTSSVITENIKPSEGYEDLVQEDDEPYDTNLPLDVEKPPIPSSIPDLPASETKQEVSDSTDSIPLPPIPSMLPDILKSHNPEPAAPRKLLTAAAKKLSPMDYTEKVSKRCPITPSLRNPINFKLTPSSNLIKRNLVELNDDDDDNDEEEEDLTVNTKRHEEKIENSSLDKNESKTPDRMTTVDEQEKVAQEHSTESNNAIEMEDDITVSPPESLKKLSIINTVYSQKDPEISTEDVSQTSIPSEDENSRSRSQSSEKQVPIEKQDLGSEKDSSEKDSVENENVDPIKEDKDNEGEKMTESISETEDERSYTPCLDENKSKDTSLETEKDKVGIEGLDTEMISEEEGNDIFSEIEDEQKSEKEISLAPKKDEEDGEIIEKKREKDLIDRKKKKKEKRLEKDSKKKKTKSEIAFKKLGKNTKERNYRDKDDKKKNRGKRKSDDDDGSDKPKKKEKRKEIERYDVRMVVSEKRRKFKDPFGRDTSRPRSKSASITLTPRRRSISPEPRKRFSRSLSKRSVSLPRNSLEPRSRSRSPQSISRLRRSRSPSKPMLRRLTPMRRLSRSISRGRRSISRPRRSISRRSMSRLRRSPVNRRSSPMLPRRRSMSPRGRKRNSISRAKKSISPRRSVSPKLRRDLSPRVRHSISPKLRRNISPRGRRSISPRGRRSISPSHRRAISPRIRRSISPKGRRSISPRRRKSISPRRHIVSPKPKKSFSPKARRSASRGRKRRRSVLRSPKTRKSKSPKKKKGSKSRQRSVSRKRSRSKPKKSKKSKLRKSRSPRRKSPKQKKKKIRSISPEIVFSPERSMERIPAEVWREPSPVYRAWSRGSRSINSRLLSPSWTPPRDISPDHYRAMLEDEERARKKQKKRQRELDKMQRHKHCKDLVGPSKEVFTSGNNILVSVSFNKDNENVGIDDSSKKRKKKDKKKRKKTNKTIIDENAKPVAIIDLEKSPFREITPSPKNVIVLSDSDHADKEDERERQTPHAENRETVPEPPVQVREPFQTGPKTPPEPSIKFSIMSKPNTQLRPLNPLDESEENEGDNQESEEARHKEAHKGPNTPPEPPNSPPSSPDAYDPFEPTKSRSQSPEAETAKKLEDNDQHQEKQTITLETAQKTNLSADDVVNQRPITPIEKVMALLQSTRNVSPTQIPNEINRDGENERAATPDANRDSQDNQDPIKTQSHFSSATVAPTVVATTAPIYLNSIPRIGAFTNAPSPRSNQSVQITSNQRIVLPSPTKSSPLKTQPTKLFLAKPSPIKSTPIKPMPKTLISKLPLPSVKPLPGRKTTDSVDVDLDSPYSPGSSDFGDLFEPPSDPTGKSYVKSGKSDAFDSLFGSKPISKNRMKNSSATKVPVKRIKKGNKTQVGVKVDEDNLKIMDELPSSAVEMQVKSKFLKKLNRQERVVEEVKLVLKPHYNKKHVTKEQYKEIMRRTVPKICHNKTGEINPAKIQALVKAYVKKYRKKNKQGTACV